mgnify:CR=1 FL=1
MIAYYGGNVVGATLSITYTVPTTGTNYYVYTINSVSADHTIIISTAGSSNVIWIKTGANTWTSYSKAYVKTASGWV